MYGAKRYITRAEFSEFLYRTMNKFPLGEEDGSEVPMKPEVPKESDIVYITLLPDDEGNSKYELINKGNGELNFKGTIEDPNSEIFEFVIIYLYPEGDYTKKLEQGWAMDEEGNFDIPFEDVEDGEYAYDVFHVRYGAFELKESGTLVVN